jgi:6-phosphogluconolactonase
MSSAVPVPVRELQLHDADVRIFSDQESLFAGAAGEFFRLVQECLAAGHDCNIALAGGSTPKGLYQLIADKASTGPTLRALDWSRVHFFFADERSVPPDHSDSNYGMVKRSLYSRNTFLPANLHRVFAEKPADAAAQEYEQELLAHFGGPPRFDLILLGIGPDGHTASLFPETAALNDTNRWVVANEVPKMKTTRITFTYPALNAAKEVMFLVSGPDKKDAIYNLLATSSDLPAARVRNSGKLYWYLDEAAASRLTS